ncbi:MAG: folate family ECF transporter S component [Oscillospiraceae bacterium]|nr:folate family ECF transporter S component [Oscillospiraceae bacterium]
MKLFSDSFKELKNIRCLVTTSMLIAVFIALKAYATIPLGASLRISLAFIALAAIGMLYGPVVAMIAAIPCDLIGAMLKGDGILPAFTLVIVFEGLIYGIFLYGFDFKKSIWQNVKLISAQAIVVFISHLILNTIALYHYGIIGGDDSTVIALISARVLKNVIEFPIDVAVLFALLIPIKAAYTRVIGARQ